MSKFYTADRSMTHRESKGDPSDSFGMSKKKNTPPTGRLTAHTVTYRNGMTAAQTAEARATTDLIGFQTEVVSLKGMQIDGDICAMLCNAMTINETVKDLDLSNNAIGDVGADAIATLLTQNPNIVSLNLSKNYISPWGAVRIVRGCRKFHSVQSLNMSGNNVGDSGLAELGRWISAPGCGLRELVLADSQISFNATVSFAESMLSNTSLLYLSVPHSLGFALIEELQKLLQRNWALYHKLDEQIEIANTVVDKLKHQTEMRDEKWNSDQKLKEPQDARTKFIGGTMEEWSDPETGSALMFLNVLERKAPTSTTSATSPSSSSANNLYSSSLSGRSGRGSTTTSTNGGTSDAINKLAPRRPRFGGAFSSSVDGKTGGKSRSIAGPLTGGSSRFPAIASPRRR